MQKDTEKSRKNIIKKIFRPRHKREIYLNITSLIAKLPQKRIFKQSHALEVQPVRMVSRCKSNMIILKPITVSISVSSYIFSGDLPYIFLIS